MNDHGAYEEEMGYLLRLSDRELDRLFDGKAPAGDGGLQELASFLVEARTLLEEAPTQPTAARHLAEIVAAAQLGAEGDDATARRARGSLVPDLRVSGGPRRRRKLVLRNPFATLGARLAAAAAAVLLLTAFGGAASAGALPDPVQGAVADAAGTVGISLPAGDNGTVDDQDDGTVDDQDDGTVDDQDDGTVDDQDDGAQTDTNTGTQGDSP